MSRKQTVSQIFAKFATEEAEIRERMSGLKSELQTLTDRLSEVEVIRSALESVSSSSSKKAASKKAAPKKAASKKAAVKKAAVKKVALKKAAKPTRKGRRKTSSGVHSMGIVDAAIHLANKNAVSEADAGDVLEWFQASGYKTRTGTPTRNSVYVSLNREASTQRDQPRVTRPRKGRFAFHGS